MIGWRKCFPTIDPGGWPIKTIKFSMSISSKSDCESAASEWYFQMCRLHVLYQEGSIRSYQSKATVPVGVGDKYHGVGLQELAKLNKPFKLLVQHGESTSGVVQLCEILWQNRNKCWLQSWNPAIWWWMGQYPCYVYVHKVWAKWWKWIELQNIADIGSESVVLLCT